VKKENVEEKSSHLNFLSSLRERSSTFHLDILKRAATIQKKNESEGKEYIYVWCYDHRIEGATSQDDEPAHKASFP